MKAASAILLTLLVAVTGAGALEYCKHGSGPVHLFFGLHCAGEAEHDHHSSHHHPEQDREGHSHGDPAGHESCTHEILQVEEDLAPGKYRVASDRMSGPLSLSPAPSMEFSGIPRFESDRFDSFSRAPPGLTAPRVQFARTIRLLI